MLRPKNEEVVRNELTKLSRFPRYGDASFQRSHFVWRYEGMSHGDECLCAQRIDAGDGIHRPSLIGLPKFNSSENAQHEFGSCKRHVQHQTFF